MRRMTFATPEHGFNLGARDGNRVLDLAAAARLAGSTAVLATPRLLLREGPSALLGVRELLDAARGDDRYAPAWHAEQDKWAKLVKGAGIVLQ